MTNDTIHKKWRSLLIFKSLKVACIISLTETVLFFFVNSAGLLFLPVPLFLLRFFFIPSIINFITIWIGYKLVHSSKLSSNAKNYVACFVFLIICICVELTHYVFAPVLCVPCVAIFMSIIFRNFSLTRTVTFISFISLIISYFIAHMELRAGDPQLFLDTAVAAVVTLCSYLLSTLLIQMEAEQAQEIVDGYIQQYRLSEQLNLDVLTGLYNRRTLFELLSTEITNADTDNVNSLFLAVLDMDNFKNINDTYGHAQGDKVLLYLSQLLKVHTTSIGYPSRYGGEEFAIVFKSSNKNKVIETLEKIRSELAEHEFQFIEDSPIVHSTVSSGLVKYSAGQSVSEFFQSADKAMYHAKQEGRNRIVFS